MKEPYISSTVYDMSGGLLPAPEDTGYNIVMPIYTPTGPLEKTKVFSQKDFMNKYMTGTKMMPSDHISSIFAYKILAQSPVYLMRACPVSVLEGVSNKGNTYLFDKSYQLISKYHTLSIKGFSDELSNYNITVDSDTYYAGTSSSDDDVEISSTKSLNKLWDGLVNKAFSNIISCKSKILISKSDITFSDNIGRHDSNSIKYYKVSGKSTSSTSTLVNNGDWLSINGVTYYYTDGSASEPLEPNPVAIRGTSETISLQLFLMHVAKLSKSLLDINCAIGSSEDVINNSNWMDNLDIESDTAFIGSVNMYIKLSDSISSSSTLSSYINTQTENTLYTYFVSDDLDNDKYLKSEGTSITIGNYSYVTGTGTGTTGKTLVKLSNGAITFSEYLSKLQKSLFETQSISMIYSTNSFILTESDYSSSSTTGLNTVYSSEISQSFYPDEQFCVIAKFPSTNKLMQFSYSADPENDLLDLHIYDFNFNFKSGEVTNNYTMSFVSGEVNGYGEDQWYTKVESDYFKLVSCTEEDSPILEGIEDFTSVKFGNLIAVPDYDNQYMIDALSNLPEYEDGIEYSVISDAGVVDPNLAVVCENLAKDLYMVYPVSINVDENTSVESIKTYASNIKSCYSRMIANSDRVPIAGFSKVLPASYALITLLINAYKNSANEFAPMFDVSGGSVTVNNLTKKWTKSERERLLDANVATFKGGLSSGWFINDNITAQKNKSYLSEEQNVRMTIEAIHSLNLNLKGYIGQLNTFALRQKVQDRANMIIQERLFRGKAYTPAMYKAVCDDTNNPISVIEANQLIVDLYASFTPSVKYILVKHYIVPLSEVS